MASLTLQEVFEIRIELYKWDRVFLKLKWRFFGQCCYIKSHVFKMAKNGGKLVYSFKKIVYRGEICGSSVNTHEGYFSFCVVPTNGGATLMPAHNNLNQFFNNWAWFTRNHWCEPARFTIRRSSFILRAFVNQRIWETIFLSSSIFALGNVHKLTYMYFENAFITLARIIKWCS